MSKLILKALSILLAALMLCACAGSFAEGIEDWAEKEPSLGLWDEGELVERLQYELSACGYYTGELSGVFDSATFRAVKELQEALGVAVDGVYGEQTHAAYVAAVRSGEIVPDYPYLHELEGLVIGIDAGHQQKADLKLESASPINNSLMKARMTAGSVGVRTGVNEQSINLAIAVMLKELLESRGATVIMSRENADVELSNMERAEIMNGAGVDCWVRLHCNYSTDHSLEGSRVLMPTGIANLSIACESRRLGYCVISAFCEATGAPMLAPHFMTDQTGFNWSTRPVITLELGYISNSASDLKLCRASYQEVCAEGVFNGIRAFFSGFDPCESIIDIDEVQD